MQGEGDGAAIEGAAIDRAAALLRRTRGMGRSREVCYRRLVDMALISEGHRVIDGPALAKRLDAGTFWPQIRCALELVHLITVIPRGADEPALIAVPLVDASFGAGLVRS